MSAAVDSLPALASLALVNSCIGNAGVDGVGGGRWVVDAVFYFFLFVLSLLLFLEERRLAQKEKQKISNKLPAVAADTQVLLQSVCVWGGGGTKKKIRDTCLHIRLSYADCD